MNRRTFNILMVVFVLAMYGYSAYSIGVWPTLKGVGLFFGVWFATIGAFALNSRVCEWREHRSQS